jgi:hypothetical protein
MMSTHGHDQQEPPLVSHTNDMGQGLLHRRYFCVIFGMTITRSTQRKAAPRSKGARPSILPSANASLAKSAPASATITSGPTTRPATEVPAVAAASRARSAEAEATARNGVPEPPTPTRPRSPPSRTGSPTRARPGTSAPATALPRSRTRSRPPAQPASSRHSGAGIDDA